MHRLQFPWLLLPSYFFKHQQKILENSIFMPAFLQVLFQAQLVRLLCLLLAHATISLFQNLCLFQYHFCPSSYIPTSRTFQFGVSSKCQGYSFLPLWSYLRCSAQCFSHHFSHLFQFGASVNFTRLLPFWQALQFSYSYAMGTIRLKTLLQSPVPYFHISAQHLWIQSAPSISA